MTRVSAAHHLGADVLKVDRHGSAKRTAEERVDFHKAALRGYFCGSSQMFCVTSRKDDGTTAPRLERGFAAPI
jgi:hypothetical protein